MSDSESCCCVCLDPFLDVLATLPCAHSYHDECIGRWADVKNTCPVCRATFHHVSLRRLSGEVFYNYGVEDVVASNVVVADLPWQRPTVELLTNTGESVLVEDEVSLGISQSYPEECYPEDPETADRYSSGATRILGGSSLRSDVYRASLQPNISEEERVAWEMFDQAIAYEEGIEEGIENGIGSSSKSNHRTTNPSSSERGRKQKQPSHRSPRPYPSGSRYSFIPVSPEVQSSPYDDQYPFQSLLDKIRSSSPGEPSVATSTETTSTTPISLYSPPTPPSSLPQSPTPIYYELPLEKKNQLQPMVRDALRPALKTGKINKKQYKTINQTVSRILYEYVQKEEQEYDQQHQQQQQEERRTLKWKNMAEQFVTHQLKLIEEENNNSGSTSSNE